MDSVANRVKPLARQHIRAALLSSIRGLSDDAASRRRRRRLLYDRILRVDHAGELGADRIYAGQMRVLGRDPVVQHMWEQEKEHLRAFERLVPQHRARPSALRPLWDSAGFALGFASALLGQRGAMACTVAVESVIAEHYDNQIRELLADAGEDHAELLDLLRRCRDDEQGHHDTGLEHGAEGAPLYGLLTAAVKAGCRGAIWVAERI
uniref:5-demethoxyubiquinone hydroxylase, mitochondrial n=1 Tax=Rhipicephalus zambeziensis TaxID=60191 RepID=A0A224YSE0_9ACAR